MDRQTDGATWDDDQLVVAVQVVHEPVVVLDSASRIVMLNERLLTLTGFARTDLLGKPIRALFPSAQAPYPRPDPVADGAGPFVAGEFADNVTVDVLRSDGSLFAARLITTPARSCTHGPIHVVTVRHEAQLTLEQIGLRGLLESAPDATVVLDPSCRVVLANTRARNLFGRSPHEIDGLHVHALFVPEHLETVHAWLRARYEAALRGDDINTHTTTFPVRVHGPGGTSIPVEVAVSALHLQEGMVLRAAFRDISERLRLQAETEQMKTHFLATISHELRTPLTSILGYTELLEDQEGPALSEEGKQFLHVIGRNARRELRLVDDLLTLVTIGEGEMPIRRHRIELAQVVLESLEALQPTARDAEVRLRVEPPIERVLVFGDAGRLGQALENVISNAIKFSPAGSRVSIRIDQTPGWARVSVTDHGPGIHGSDQERVFERLYRGAQAIEDEKPGAGLGLTIVKAIVEAHDGKIGTSSPAAGGTRVDIVLPALVPGAPSRP